MSTKTSKQKIVTGVGLVNVTSDPILIDLRRFHFGITIACGLYSTAAGVAGGTAAYKVQNCFDPQEQGAPIFWVDHDILINLTASAASNLAFPATWVRLVIASLTGTLVLSAVEAIGTS